jgi:hypothetical protein
MEAKAGTPWSAPRLVVTLEPRVIRDVATFYRVCHSVPKRTYRWQQRLLRIGLSGWLWLTAAILAVILIVLYLA